MERLKQTGPFQSSISVVIKKDEQNKHPRDLILVAGFLRGGFKGRGKPGNPKNSQGKFGNFREDWTNHNPPLKNPFILVVTLQMFVSGIFSPKIWGRCLQNGWRQNHLL